MKRLLIHVEGQTEETFVNEVLRDYLVDRGFQDINARLIGDPRKKRGGIQAWNVVRKDILNHLKEDNKCYATTMVDFYGLPQSGDKAWPKRAEASIVPFSNRSDIVQDAMLADITSEYGGNFHPIRFVPFVIMHEFEGLLFSDPIRFADGIAREDLTEEFIAILDQFNSPEEINDTPTGHPSQRIKDLIPGYQKPFLGAIAVLEIGVDIIREKCPNFNRWLTILEDLPEIDS